MPCDSFLFIRLTIFCGRYATMSFMQAADAAKTRKSPMGICTRTASIGYVRTHPHFCNLSFWINRQKFACKGILPLTPFEKTIARYGISKS